MKAHVGRVLAALTVDELREVRERLDVLVRDAGHPEMIASREEQIVAGEEHEGWETVDDRSGWILERCGDLGNPHSPPMPVHRGWVEEG